MRHAMVWLGVVVAAWLVDLQAQDPVPVPKKGQPAKGAPSGLGVRFSGSPVAVTGVTSTVMAVAVTPDGKHVASAGGSITAGTPTTGFVSLLDAETKKEQLGLKLTRQATSVAFSK